MILFTFSLFLQVSFWENTVFTRTATANRIKQEASVLYGKEDFLSASLKYKTLLNDLELKEEEIVCNLAHCYFYLSDTANARLQYEKLTLSSQKKLKSISFQQLGILAFLRSEKEKALLLTKQALQNDPHNEKARFNYEWLRKQNISEKIPDNITSGNQIPDSKEQNTPDSPENPPPSPLRKPKNIELSQEKANAILEAVQEEENRRSSQKRQFSNKKVDTDKPDW